MNPKLNESSVVASSSVESWRPDPRFDEPAVLSRVLTRRVLSGVKSPARYIGGELGTTAEGFDPQGANFLLTFPDAYEVGMSHQGLRILYTLLQKRDNTFCDLAFAPFPDMEAAMRAEGLPLYGMATRRAAAQYDVIGFSLGYELIYSNMVNMINLSGSPIWAKDRGEGDPIFLAGGSCVLNPTVVSPFLDLILLGDGEESILDIAELIVRLKKEGATRAEILAAAKEVEGAWYPEVEAPVRARVLQDLNTFPPPDPIVPTIEPVHDRLALEVMRGCVRGCRFCQAGMITRPVRERDAGALIAAAAEGIAEAGLAEVSLLSLSTGDYTGLGETVVGIQAKMVDQHTNLALPSLRVDSVDEGLYQAISRERPSNFTFAPEAGSQRLRDVINKNVSEADILKTAKQALDSGVKSVKLYFMIGLPTETDEDLDELIKVVTKVVALAPRGGSQIHVSLSPFSPKAHTPFQWAGQIDGDEIRRRNGYVAHPLRHLKVKVSLREPETSHLEGLLGLGDEKLSQVVATAWRNGARFDAWDDHFRFDIWQHAMTAEGLDSATYLAPREVDDPLPWDSVDAGVEPAFLKRDWKRAIAAKVLPGCRLEGAYYNSTSCSGDLLHTFAKREALGDMPARRGPAIPSHGRGAVKLKDEPRPATPLLKWLPTSVDPEFDPRNSDPSKPSQELSKWQNWRNQAYSKCWYRVEFAKTDDMVFLGQLDFQRQLHLALRRSGLPAAYSKGYHPRPMLKFGPPLPVGIAGLRESLDIALEHQVPGWVEKINATLPKGIKILRSVVVGGQNPGSIDQSVTRFDYQVEIPGVDDGGPAPETVAAALDVFLAATTWPCLRKRPKGDIMLDARALVPTGAIGLDEDTAAGFASRLRVTLLRSETGAILPAHDFLTALLGDALPNPGHCVITRTGCYGRHTDGRWLSPIEEVGESGLRFWLGKHMIA